MTMNQKDKLRERLIVEIHDHLIKACELFDFLKENEEIVIQNGMSVSYGNYYAEIEHKDKE